MKVLVTGTDGYIGVMLAQELIKRGHDVIGLDTGFYRSGWLFNGVKNLPETVSKDIRDISEEDLQGFDAIVHLAELSNDPIGRFAPQTSYDINHKGSVRLASLCKKVGVKRFVYTSSCSVYGVGNAEIVDEKSPVNPQTAYSECKVLVEKDVGALSDDNFSPTFLRNATCYGPSPRMRFDVVLNNLAGLAWTTGKITLKSDGTPWRPLVHVLDACQAIFCVLEAPKEAIHNEIFNVGDTKENYRVREIAEIVAKVFPGTKVEFGERDSDNRSYKVSFDKIKNKLGFKCQFTVKDGAKQLYELFKRVNLTKEMFEANPYTRLNQLQYLKRTKQIDERFFWTKV